MAKPSPTRKAQGLFDSLPGLPGLGSKKKKPAPAPVASPPAAQWNARFNQLRAQVQNVQTSVDSLGQVNRNTNTAIQRSALTDAAQKQRQDDQQQTITLLAIAGVVLFLFMPRHKKKKT
jgi:hypothetical protein